ncbi:MAG: pseudouridine synthase [Treponema sp.]
MQKKIFTLSADDAHRRIDRVLRKFLVTVPLSGIYSALRKGLIRINGKRVKADYITSKGDILAIASLLIPSSPSAEAVNKKQCAANSRLGRAAGGSETFSILLRTQDILAINKPAGISVHGEQSLTHRLLQNSADIFAPAIYSLSFKAGPLHRLDKHTTGCICFSQSLHGAQWFSDNLRRQRIIKYYLGIVEGKPKSGRLKTCEESGEALTYYTAAAYNTELNCTLVLFRPVTGRKHQIRKHAHYIGYPLVGDSQYGSRHTLPAYSAYFLHAWKLIFPRDRPHGIPAQLEAPLFANAVALTNRLFPGWEASLRAIIDSLIP